jgi:DNA replication protein DnaC
MMDSSTINKMYELRLPAMAKEYSRQISDPNCHAVGFEERVALIVDLEWQRRNSNRISRLLKKASLGIPDACIENILYIPDRNLDKGQIASLGSCSYIANHKNIIIMGASGSGKSFLGCAFGNAACRSLYSAMYIRLPELLVDLAMARAENTYRSVIKQYKKVRLLILDEWLLYPLKQSEARDLLEIIEARNRIASTIFCSQFAVDGWHEKIGETALADAVCDRTVHSSYKIIIQGDSMRRRLGIEGHFTEA